MIDANQLNTTSVDSRTVTLFVGAAQKFPERLLDVFRSELPEVQFVRVDNLADVAGWHSAVGGLSLIILNEDFATSLLDGSTLIMDAVRSVPVALGYRDDAIAYKVLAGLNGGQLGNKLIGFLPLDVQMEVWLSVMRLLQCHEVFYPQCLLRAVKVKTEGTPQKSLPSYALTPREREVLELVSLGKQNKAIAVDLQLSEHTVKLHLHNVLKKLGVSNRTAAANLFAAVGLQDSL